MKLRCDVVVLGSGFAGSLLAAVLASQGRSVIVIDRGSHPRFTIGESSTPTADFLLRKIATRYGLDEVLPLTSFGSWQDTYPSVACGCKRGFSYIWHAGDQGFRATDDHACELLVAASDSRASADTQWYRPDVDAWFVDVARGRGARILENATVHSIQRMSALGWSIDADVDHEGYSIRCEFIVDASGPHQLLMSKLSVTDISDDLHTNTSAVYGHFANVPLAERWLLDQGAVVQEYPYPVDDAALHHVFHDGWLWQLRFENGCTSLGYVSADCDSLKPPKDADARWHATLGKHPVLKQLTRDARLASFPGRMYSTSRLQRLSSAAAGDDWAAMPFTVGFIDPLHSTGIAHSLSCVDRLSEILLSDPGKHQSESLSRYSADVVLELRHVDRMVAGCYASLGDFRMFGAFAMVYFAAATTSEQRWLRSPGDSPGFLLSDDADFGSVVRRLLCQVQSFRDRETKMSDAEIEQWVDHVRCELEPFNHVGLFRPQKPNLYQRTVAQRSSSLDSR